MTREAYDQLAFGAGIHFCLGAHLARLERRLVLGELLRRVERLELAGPVAWSAAPVPQRPEPRRGGTRDDVVRTACGRAWGGQGRR